jgi:hypothetical protein
MPKRNSTTHRRKAQPKVTITAYPDGYERLLELAERRGYSERALTALLASAIAAQVSLRPRRQRKIVPRHA